MSRWVSLHCRWVGGRQEGKWRDVLKRATKGGGGNLSQEAGSVIDPICMASPDVGKEDGQKLKQGGLPGCLRMTAIASIPGSLPRLWLLLSQLRLMGLGRELAESRSLRNLTREPAVSHREKGTHALTATLEVAGCRHPSRSPRDVTESPLGSLN